MGRIYEEWIKVRRAYLNANPPNHQGYYVCYLCRVWIPANEVTVDHIVSRSRAPQLRFVFSNLAVCCSPCNEAKGSTTVIVEEIIEDDNELDGLW